MLNKEKKITITLELFSTENEDKIQELVDEFENEIYKVSFNPNTDCDYYTYGNDYVKTKIENVNDKKLKR